MLNKDYYIIHQIIHNDLPTLNAQLIELTK
jgi:hypothetical protein